MTIVKHREIITFFLVGQLQNGNNGPSSYAMCSDVRMVVILHFDQGT